VERVPSAQTANSPLTVAALDDLRERCDRRQGFHAGPDKKRAVETLRALHHEAAEPFDPAAIRMWAEADGGWSLPDARNLGRIARGVLLGRKFRGAYNRAILRDPTAEQAMVTGWRDTLGKR
jgi:hypothetical protein